MLRPTDTRTFRVVQETLELGFQQMSASSWADEEPFDRHLRFCNSLLTLSDCYDFDDERLGRLSTAPLVDAGSVAFSAFEASKLQTACPATTALNSLGLLSFGALEDERKRVLLRRITEPWIAARIVLPEYLEVDTQNSQVDFTTVIKTELADLAQPGFGCPGQGRIMEEFYRRYVGVVFGPELAVEALMAAPASSAV